MAREFEVRKTRNELEKFLVQEYNFLRNLEWWVGDHAITTKQKLFRRRMKIRDILKKK
jgi:hypothetical protein